jgi:hypothetical protein
VASFCGEAVLHRFGEITADLTERFGGTVVKSTGDGHLATFDGPTPAIRCAEAVRAEAETRGIQIRIGIHTGECELLDADIGGIAVHIAARILGSRLTASIGALLTVIPLVGIVCAPAVVTSTALGVARSFAVRCCHIAQNPCVA